MLSFYEKPIYRSNISFRVHNGRLSIQCNKSTYATRCPQGKAMMMCIFAKSLLAFVRHT